VNSERPFDVAQDRQEPEVRSQETEGITLAHHVWTGFHLCIKLPPSLKLRRDKSADRMAGQAKSENTNKKRIPPCLLIIHIQNYLNLFDTHRTTC
jgi:hypothetical protein